MPPVIPAPSHQSGTLTLDWMTGNSLSESLAAEWDQLIDLSPNGTVFQRFEWLSAWWHTRGGNSNLAVLLIRDGGRLVGLAPLYFPIAGRWRYLRVLGEGDSDYCNLVVDPTCQERIWPILLGEIQTFCKHHELQGIIAVDLANHDLRVHCEQRGFFYRILNVMRCPYVPLPETWSEFLSEVAKNKRLEIPRYLRRLEKQYEVTFRASHTTDETREATMGCLFEMHTRYWNRRNQPGAFPPGLHSFHRKVAASLKGQLRLYEMSLDGIPRAVFYGYYYKGKMFSYQTGVDPDFTQNRLGTLIFAYAIEQTIREGGREFDFARGDEPYKSQTWRAKRDRFNTSLAVPMSPRSKVAFRLSRGDGIPGHGLRDVAGMLLARLNGNS